MISIVYMVAGLSSRFGGKIKQFAKVGAQGETLIEVSMQQAIEAGFDKIIFIVGEKTEEAFKEKFGNEFEGTPIKYAKQELDLKKRDKPWGTVDALVSAKDVIEGEFVVCNGDDLYGTNALKQAKEFLEKNKENACVGYKLENVLPEEGKTNRGIFKINENNEVIKIKEVFEIEKNNLKEKCLEGKERASMNLFALQLKTINLLEKKLEKFKKENEGDRKAECLLPEELGNLIKEGKIVMKLIETNDKWFGVTNPDDEEKVRKTLAQEQAKQ
jgi:dTDP-glucose pyrophosphorylase